MNKAQRKTHYYAWLSLAFLLPAGIICGWIAIPSKVYQPLLQPAKSLSLPFVNAILEKPGYTLRLNSDKMKTHWQLEWASHIAITTPSVLIYQAAGAASATDSSALIGRVGEQGVYYFSLKPVDTGKNFHFILYDVIHHRILDRIEMKP